MHWTTMRNCETWAREFVETYADTPQDRPLHDHYTDALMTQAWGMRWDAHNNNEDIGKMASELIDYLAKIEKETP